MKNIRLFPRFKAYYQGPKSDHYDGLHFFNPWNPQRASFYNMICWKMTSKRKHWPAKIKNHQVDIPPKSIEGNKLRVSFVGHSTMLIQTQGLNILTDPIWSDRASPSQYFGPVRYSDPGIVFESLPRIDLVLISHNHYDHLDLSTLEKLWRKDRPLIIAPLGNEIIIQSKDPSIQVKTLDWHQAIKVGNNVSIHLTPTQHWSGRGFFDRNKALWGAFVISTTGGNIYFCGDSGYGSGYSFREALKQFGSFRFAMLPIGAYEPRWFMEYSHMNPEEAALAYKDLGEPYTVGIHFLTFRLADEGFYEPGGLLKEICKKRGVSQERFRTLKIGGSWMVPELNPNFRKIHWKLNTSNRGKLEEFQKLFAHYGATLEATQVDLDEIQTDALQVVAHKASQLEENVLIDDTSLDIVGAEVGINVRWLLEHLPNFLNKKAYWHVFLAYRVGEQVFIYKGEVEGTIVAARGEGGFGFDPFFLPDGTQQTLAQSKPDQVNARALAVQALMDDQKFATVAAVHDWKGPWQKS